MDTAYMHADAEWNEEEISSRSTPLSSTPKSKRLFNNSTPGEFLYKSIKLNSQPSAFYLLGKNAFILDFGCIPPFKRLLIAPIEASAYFNL